MQSAVKHQTTLRLSLIAVACHVACLSMSAAHAQTTPAAEPAKADHQVVITGKKLGMGLMVTEDAPKARSTITAEELEKQRPSGNAYEALEMLPSVNSFSHDATGMFNGGLTLRGFNSDQIGATINGVPVNDSGSFSVFPQEYVDQENTCSEFVTQGSTDVDSPQVGATGGNFGINTCNPEDKRRVRLVQSLGGLNFSKTFVRYDSGLFADNRSKIFVSFSHGKTDKWKGLGQAQRDHIDAGFNYDWDRFNYVHGTLLYNEAINNNIGNLTKAQADANYMLDFSPSFTPGHLPGVNGTVQKETGPSPAYYGLQLNPFKNLIASATAKFRLSENTDLKILPYLWWGFGNGGFTQLAQSETGYLNTTTGKIGAGVDLNHDGDTLDTVIVGRSSVTKTFRPGGQVSLTHTIGDHTLLGGVWYERARHIQTQPETPVDNNGNPADYYLDSGKILRPDGSAYQGRDTKTISTAYQVYVQDTINILNDKGSINIGLRTPSIRRDFTSYPNEGTSSLIGYKVDRTYHDVLPQLGARYRVTNDDQFYGSIAKNMKAPGNFAYFPSNGNVTFPGGVAVLSSDVKSETSYNTDVGYRHQDSNYIFTFNVFNVDFRDRLATAYDPILGISSTTNVGKVKTRGFEIETGNTPIHGWAFYGSLGYADSKILNDLPLSATLSVPTNGKQMPQTPKLKAGLSVEYQDGAFYTRLKAKSTSMQQATLVNDEHSGGYTVFGIDGGYTFANFGLVKRPKLQWNISNLLDKRYLSVQSQTTQNALPFPGQTKTSQVFYYEGAPRFISLTLSVDM